LYQHFKLGNPSQFFLGFKSPRFWGLLVAIFKQKKIEMVFKSRHDRYLCFDTMAAPTNSLNADVKESGVTLSNDNLVYNEDIEESWIEFLDIIWLSVESKNHGNVVDKQNEFEETIKEAIDSIFYWAPTQFRERLLATTEEYMEKNYSNSWK
jgi:hypothetical protein